MLSLYLQPSFSLPRYKIMLSCWHPRPEDRPAFHQLVKKVDRLLEATQNYIDLSMDISADYFRPDPADPDR